MTEPQKVYESIPAYEMVKFRIVNELNEISDMHKDVQAMIFLHRKDRRLFCKFRSYVLAFYQYLRPKIVQQANKQPAKYGVLVDQLDYFIQHPTKFSLDNAIFTINNLNQFCEDYKLTSTTFWSGVASTGKGVYNV